MSAVINALLEQARRHVRDNDGRAGKAFSLVLENDAFNIEARYPDMKRDFRRTCTPEYTDQQMAAIKEMFAWLRSQQA